MSKKSVAKDAISELQREKEDLKQMKKLYTFFLFKGSYWPERGGL
jgi:hypothetical protein